MEKFCVQRRKVAICVLQSTIRARVRACVINVKGRPEAIDLMGGLPRPHRSRTAIQLQGGEIPVCKST